MNRLKLVALTIAAFAIQGCTRSTPPDSARMVALSDSISTPSDEAMNQPHPDEQPEPKEEAEPTEILGESGEQSDRTRLESLTTAAEKRVQGSIVDLRVSNPNIDPPPSTLGTVIYLLGEQDLVIDDCTGFYVAENLFMTAMHCVTPNGVDVSVGGRTHNATCRQGPGGAADWALCRFDDWKAKSWMSLAGCPLTVDDEVLILGYCSEDGQITAGKLTTGPVQDGFLPLVPPEGENPNVCPTDSGGPAFRLLPGQQPPGEIVGVISKIDDCTGDGTTQPCIAPTTTSTFRTFLSKGNEGLTLPDCP